MNPEGAPRTHDFHSPPSTASVVRSLSDAVSERLRQSVDDDTSPLAPLVKRLTLAKDAKRIRVRVLEAFATPKGHDHIVDGRERRALTDLGAAIELIHAGSLLHDDVIDDGETRRGVPTANRTDGNLNAVLAGDYALAKAMAIVAQHGERLSAKAASTLAEMVDGVARETAARGHDIDVATWRKVAEGKTGALFAFATTAAHNLRRGDVDDERVLDRAGRAFGVLFQLVDDVIDFFPGRGKDPFQDLAHESPNIVVATARARGLQVPAPTDMIAVNDDKHVCAPGVARDATGAVVDEQQRRDQFRAVCAERGAAFIDAFRASHAKADVIDIAALALSDVRAALVIAGSAPQSLVDEAEILLQDALALLGSDAG